MFWIDRPCLKWIFGIINDVLSCSLCCVAKKYWCGIGIYGSGIWKTRDFDKA